MLPQQGILVIDEALMTRQSISHMLLTRGQDWRVMSVATPEDAAPNNLDLILWNIRSARIGDSAMADRIADLRERLGDKPIILISNLDDYQLAFEALRRQIRGYVPATLGADMLIAAVRLVLAGGVFVSERLITQYIQDQSRPIEAPGMIAAEQAEPAGLTIRELDITRCLQHGKSNKIIAFELGISESTVKVHVRNIMKKMHATNRTQVACRSQIIKLPGPVAAPAEDPAEAFPIEIEGISVTTPAMLAAE